MLVELGNAKAVQQVTTAEGDTILEPVEGARVTTVNIPDENSLSEAFVVITDPRGVWAAHSEQGEKATWVYSDNAALQYLLAQHFGCDEGRPDNVEATHYTLNGAPGQGPDGPVNKDGSLKASAKKDSEDDQ